MNTNIPTITVDPELRELILPSEKLVLGINGDVEVNAVQFQLPLTYRELELKKLTPRINYVNANGDTNYYETVMKSDESNCYFIWPLTPDITAYTGHVRFSLTLYQTEGDNILHKFNTRSATGRVYTGFEAEKQVTPEQQQTLLSKLETQIKADLNDHTERLKNELTEKGKEILDGFGESGNVSEELKTIKQDLGTKLTAPQLPKLVKSLKSSPSTKMAHSLASGLMVEVTWMCGLMVRVLRKTVWRRYRYLRMILLDWYTPTTRPEAILLG